MTEISVLKNCSTFFNTFWVQGSCLEKNISFSLNSLLSYYPFIFFYLDFALLIIFVWNLLTNLYRYCLPTFIQKRQTLSNKQKKLLGISTENGKHALTL